MGIGAELFQLAWPSVLSNVVTESTGLTTILFVTSFNDQYLLGSVGLGEMAQNVFGFSLGRGLNSALGTLVSQAYGAGEDRLCRLFLQQAQLLSLMVCLPSTLVLLFAEQLFRLVGINERSAHDAGQYVLGTLLSMPFVFLWSATRLFMRAVKVPKPEFYMSIIVACLHPCWCVLLLNVADLFALGAGFTVMCSNLMSFMLLTGYVAVVRPGPCKYAWRCLPSPFELCRSSDLQSVDHGFRAYLKVALPSAALMWSEWWVYEIMSLFAGLCSTEELAVHTALCNILLVVFMAPAGLGSATSTAVGNAMGAGEPIRARAAMRASAGSTAVLMGVVALLVVVARRQLAHFFSSDAKVVATFEGMCFVFAPFIVIDALQTVLEGALVGLGLQRPASHVKLWSMFGVRLCGAYILAFPLGLGLAGIWLAGLCGMCLTLALYVKLLRASNLEVISMQVRQRLHEQQERLDGRGFDDVQVGASLDQS